MFGALKRTLVMQNQMRGDVLFLATCGLMLTTDHLFFNRFHYRLYKAGIMHKGSNMVSSIHAINQ